MNFNALEISPRRAVSAVLRPRGSGRFFPVNGKAPGEQRLISSCPNMFLRQNPPFFIIFVLIPTRFGISSANYYHFIVKRRAVSILIYNTYGEITGDLHEEATREKQAEEKRR